MNCAKGQEKPIFFRAGFAFATSVNSVGVHNRLVISQYVYLLRILKKRICFKSPTRWKNTTLWQIFCTLAINREKPSKAGMMEYISGLIFQSANEAIN